MNFWLFLLLGFTVGWILGGAIKKLYKGEGTWVDSVTFILASLFSIWYYMVIFGSLLGAGEL